jgi:glycerol-3-phosphate dehydrogenase subunit C
MKADIDRCIKCSICNVYCPVLKATALFPGPKLSGPDAERFRRRQEGIPADWLELCDYCKICERVCPHQVPIAELHLRARMNARKIPRPSLRAWIFGHSDILQKLGSWGAPFSNWITRWAFFRWLLDRGLGIDLRTGFPSYERQTFEKWFHSRRPANGIPIAYFHGCFTNTIEPEVGRSVVEVLEKNGFQVTLPRQECCGLPLISNGYFHLAARVGQRNIASLTKTVKEGNEIVFSSPSCGMTLTQEYDRILQLEGIPRLAGHVHEIFQFLLWLYELGKLNTDFLEIKETYYYHAPCHLRALQIGLPALEVLSLIPGLQIVELPEGCCGLAGTYGFKKEKYEVAREIGQDLFEEIGRLQAKTVISECEACRFQIHQHTGVKTLHPIQILRQAYGR